MFDAIYRSLTVLAYLFVLFPSLALAQGTDFDSAEGRQSTLNQSGLPSTFDAEEYGYGEGEETIDAEGTESTGSTTGDVSVQTPITKITKVDTTALSANKYINRKLLKQCDIYGGIIPGQRNWHKLIRMMKERIEKNGGTSKNRMTWIGFIDQDAGSSLFLQTLQTASYSIAESDGGLTLTVTLSRTSIPKSNDLRIIDTRFWSTALIGAKAKSSGGNAVVTISLHSSVSYSVRQEDEFLYIDFNDEGVLPYAVFEHTGQVSVVGGGGLNP